MLIADFSLMVVLVVIPSTCRRRAPCVLLGLLASACVRIGYDPIDLHPNEGGAGRSSVVLGGTSGNGNVRSSAGGISGANGANTTGGTVATGGTSIGGTTSIGGSITMGGAVTTGGVVNVSAVGGFTSIGGSIATGSTTSIGGFTSIGGAIATGGTTSIGGTTATGGFVNASTVGGTTSIGGTTTALGGATGTFGTPMLIAAVSDATATDANPSFTGDRLELYFNSTRTGGPGMSDLWVSKRTATNSSWGTPQLVAALSTTSKESTPKVSADGLTLWFSSDRTGCVGKLDIWGSTRANRSAAWRAPTCVSEVNSSEADSGASASATLLTMVLASKRTGSQSADLYWTTRASTSAVWASPTLITNVNTAGDDGDGQLIRGGLQLYFATSGRGTSTDLYFAERSSTSGTFTSITPLTELNTTSEETGPWLSEDGHNIIFASNRTGYSDLYEASR